MHRHRYLPGLALSVAFSCLLTGCGLLKSDEKEAAKEGVTPALGKAGEAKSDVSTVRLISAQTPAVKSYRKTAAAHIYKTYAKRIYKGKIPPLVYAVVVIETDIDANGKVVNVSYSRIPSHAPEVPPQIAELIKEASPLPNPGKLGAHTYVETWLWDKGGNFQLDSLTLGQRSR